MSAPPSEPLSTAEKKRAKSAAVVNEQHIRLNFLHQAALLVAQQSTEEEDAFSKISRKYVREMRECLNSDRVKVEPNFMRTFCKKCKQVLLNGNIARFDLTMVQRRVIKRTCKRCGSSVNLQIGEHLSRNERHQQEEAKNGV